MCRNRPTYIAGFHAERQGELKSLQSLFERACRKCMRSLREEEVIIAVRYEIESLKLLGILSKI